MTRDSPDALPAPEACCYICSLAPVNAEFLTKAQHPYFFRRVWVCPECAPRHTRRDIISTLVWLTVCFFLFQILTGGFRFSTISNSLLFVLGLIIMIPLALILHEAAHAAVAAAVKWNVHGVFLGMGKLLWQGRYNDTLLQVRRVMAAGLVWASPRDYRSKAMPLQAILIFAAGPAINLGLGFPALLYRFSDAAATQPWILTSGIFLFGGVNIGFGVGNLMPWAVFNFGVPQYSDGKNILLALFQPGKLRVIYAHSQGLSHVMALRQLGELQKACAAAMETVAEHPRNLGALVNASAVLIETHQYERGVELARRGLQLIAEGADAYDPIFGAKPDVAEKLFRAVFQCNTSYGLLRLEDTVSAEAVTYAAESYKAMPWHPNAQMLQGYALARQGKPQEGLQLYLKAVNHWTEYPDELRRQYIDLQREIEGMCAAMQATESHDSGNPGL